MEVYVRLDVDFGKFKDYDKLRDKLDALLYREGIKFSSFVKENELSGQSLRVRTGRLRNSFGNRFSKYGYFKKTRGKVEVGSKVKYARIHEYGGVIKPKGGKYLAIPLPSVLTPSGMPRFFWKKRGDIKRQYPDAFVIRSKRGKLLLVRKNGRRIVPLFVLKTMVRLRERAYLRRSAAKYKDIYLNDLKDIIKGLL